MRLYSYIIMLTILLCYNVWYLQNGQTQAKDLVRNTVKFYSVFEHFEYIRHDRLKLLIPSQQPISLSISNREKY